MDGAASWLKRIVITRIMLNSLGADMTAMQEYFLLVSKAFTVMQYCFCAILFLITAWQLFRVFGGPITEERTR